MRPQSAWSLGKLPGPFLLSAILFLLLLHPFGCGDGYYYGPFPHLLFLNPLHSVDTLIYEPELIGTWRDIDGEDTIIFSGNGEQTGYRVELTFNMEENYSISIPFTAHLVLLGEQMYLDLELNVDELELDKQYRELFLPVHWFYRVSKTDQTLILAYPDVSLDGSDSIRSYLRDHSEDLDFVIAGTLREPKTPQDKYTEEDEWSTTILVTAQTGDLQRFIIEHQGDEDEIIFNDSEELERVKAEP